MSESLMKKRGAAHIEMITAFVLFFGFVFFLLLILKPYETTSISETVVSGVHDSFEKQTRTNLTQVFLMADAGDFSGDCFYVIFPQEIFNQDLSLSRSYVTDLGGMKFDSRLFSGQLNIKDSGNARYYRVYLSPDFPDDSSVSGCVLPEDYTLGGIVEQQIISYNKLIEMSGKYYEDYDLLKRELRVPEVYDFLIVVGGIGEADMEIFVPPEGDVIANEYIAEVLYPNGTIVTTDVSIKVW